MVMLFNTYFYKKSLLEESVGVLDQLSQINNLKEFLAQQKSPYMLLQILAIALVNLPDMPAYTLEQLNANPQLLRNEVVNKKMHYLMTKTRFSNDFNEAFRNTFPDSTANPIEWAKKNRDIATNLDSPEIKSILSSVVSKYNS